MNAAATLTRIPRLIRPTLFVTAGLALLALAACTDYDDNNPIGGNVYDDMPISLLLDVSGENSSVGNASWTAAFLAQDDRLTSQPNDAIAAIMSGYDSQGEPAIARSIVNGFDYRVPPKLIIGPTASDVGAALSWSLDPIPAEGGYNVPIYLSPSSSSLALEAVDNLLRLAPSDRLQAEAIVEFVLNSPYVDDSVSPLIGAILVPVGDAWASDLAFVIEELLTPTQILTFGYTKNSLPAIIDQIEDRFQDAEHDLTGNRNTVIFFGGAQDAVSYFNRISDKPAILRAIHACAGGVTASQALEVNEPAASNASAVHLTGPVYAHDLSGVAGDVYNDLMIRLGHVPDPWALNAYDAYMLLDEYARIYEPKYLTDDVDPGKLERIIRDELMSLASISTGITGPLDLDENGDRIYATFNYWTLSEGTWVGVGNYHRDENGNTTLTFHE